MKAFCAALVFSALTFTCITAAASSAKKASSPLKTFVSTDHAITLQYSAPLVLCHENTPACQDYFNLCMVGDDTAAAVACLGYDGHAYKGYNFTGAALAVGIVSGVKDEATCVALQGDKAPDEIINGVTFKSSKDGDAGMGHIVEISYYRAFDRGRCYAADLRIATTNIGNYDPGTVKEFKSTDHDKVFRKLKQALQTLRLAGK